MILRYNVVLVGFGTECATLILIAAIEEGGARVVEMNGF